MDIILLVTGCALQCGFPVFLSGLVALHAVQPGVLAPQQEVGLGVIKFGFVEHRNFLVASFVVGMATPAGRVCLAPVETCLATDISPHILVAGHAQPVLGLAIEADVALLAVLFDFRMGLDQLAGRHDGLNVLRAGRPTSSTA